MNISKRVINCGLLTLVLMSGMLLVSCKTLEPETVIVTKTVLPPEVIFPDFPAIDGIEYLDGFVKVPDYVWISLAQYGLDVKKTEDQYKAFRSE